MSDSTPVRATASARSARRGLGHRTFTIILALLTSAVFALPLAVPSASAAIIPGRCTYTSNQPTLRQGSTGSAVRQMQCELNYSMYYTKVTVDGIFGPKTASAVRVFQSCAGIAVDGVVGPQTWGHLNYWAGSNYWLYC